MLNAFLVILVVFCGLRAIQAKRLVAAALWLAAVSALIAIVIYEMGAREAAVIELSVGSGLVTVLFVFAIGISGEEAMKARAIVPRPLALGLIILSLLLLGGMILPLSDRGVMVAERGFADTMWQKRGLDVIAQITLVFVSVIGILGVLSEARTPRPIPSERAHGVDESTMERKEAGA